MILHMDARTDPAAGPENELSGSGHSGSPTQNHKPSEHAPPAAPLIMPPQVDSSQSLSQAAEAQTGAPDRFACLLTAPPGAHSSSSASVHPSVRPRELASPAPPPAQGDGGFQHAPVLMESTMALTESVGALISSVPLPWQHEDRGHQTSSHQTPLPNFQGLLPSQPLTPGTAVWYFTRRLSTPPVRKRYLSR
jgi:hypothetical protein